MTVTYEIPDPMDAHINTFSSQQLILLAHGSRDSNWTKTFESGLEVINRHVEADATLAYMEMAEPSLESVISNYYLRGVRQFKVLPLFFAAGRHLLHDVPAQIAKLHEQYEGTDIRLLEAVGKQDVFWHALGTMIASEYNMPVSVDTISQTGSEPGAETNSESVRG